MGLEAAGNALPRRMLPAGYLDFTFDRTLADQTQGAPSAQSTFLSIIFFFSCSFYQMGEKIMFEALNTVMFLGSRLKIGEQKKTKQTIDRSQVDKNR